VPYVGVVELLKVAFLPVPAQLRTTVTMAKEGA